MYELINPPVTEPTSLADVKSSLRVEHTNDDALISSLLVTARTFLERRIDIAILPQTWRATVPAGQDRIILRPSRVLSVSAVTYSGQSGQTVAAPEDWTLRRGRPDCVELRRAPPAGTTDILVDFEAGFVDIASVPADLIRAISLLAAHYYEERELFRAQRYVPVPLSIDALIQPYREVRV